MCAGAVLLGTSIAYSAQPAFKPGTALFVRGTAQTDHLNLRAEASSTSKVIAELLPNATGIVATGRSKENGAVTWVEVRYRGQAGWLNAHYVRAAGSTEHDGQAAGATMTGQSTTGAEPKPSAPVLQVTEGTSLRVYGIAKGDNLNVREFANAKSAVVLEVAPDAADLIATGRTSQNASEMWLEIRYGAKQGWVNSRFVRKEESRAKTAEIAEPPKATATIVSPAALSTDAAAECDSDDAEVRLRGCAALIERGTLTPATLAIALGRRSDSYLARSDYDLAIADRAQALKLEPGSEDSKRRLAAGYRSRASNRQDRKDAEGALKDLGEAIRINSADTQALAARAALYIRAEKIDPAIADLTAAHEIAPSDQTFRSMLTEIYIQRGTAALVQNRYDPAIAEFAKAIGIDPANAVAYLRRGSALAAKGDASALADFGEAIRLDPNLADAYLRRARLLMSRGDHGQAVKDLDEVLRVTPANRDALLAHALALEQGGESLRAIVDYRKVLAAEPSHKEAQRGVKRLERKEALQQTLLTPPVEGTATDTGGNGPTYWNHNGSTMKLVADGARRRFYYEDPRPAIRDSGVASGTLLFDGSRLGTTYSGTARIFSSRCGTVRYTVSGPIGEDERSVTLFGQAPQLGASCEVTGYRADTLLFYLMQE